MGQLVGKQSIQFEKNVYILSRASIVGPKEGEGPLGVYFDYIGEDGKFGAKSWEAAESELQKETALLAIRKARLKPSDIRILLAGDLLAQSVASAFGSAELNIPMYGIYGACSTMGEALSLGACMVAGEFVDFTVAVTSSHFASAEKEFRFPLGYGNQRPLSSSWTVTGSGACVLGSKRSQIKISGITTGKIIDFGLKDSQNMGACMAPAALDTIYRNLLDFSRTPDYYDYIITGDLGKVGSVILLDMLEQKGYGRLKNHVDCGCLIFDDKRQNTHAGGSGCGCAASVLTSYILPKIESGEWKRILFVPTGALLSKVSFSEGNTVPGIAHAVVIEHEE